ncbi:MAG: hypothetical protein QXD80_06515 [Acidilobaceae archaeon]
MSLSSTAIHESTWIPKFTWARWKSLDGAGLNPALALEYSPKPPQPFKGEKVRSLAESD